MLKLIKSACQELGKPFPVHKGEAGFIKDEEVNLFMRLIEQGMQFERTRNDRNSVEVIEDTEE